MPLISDNNLFLQCVVCSCRALIYFQLVGLL